MKLALEAGRWCGVYSTIGVVSHYVEPAQWKGQVPKEIHHPRVWAALAPLEQSLVHEACNGVAPSKRHNVLDAVGLGQWVRKHRVACSGSTSSRTSDSLAALDTLETAQRIVARPANETDAAVGRFMHQKVFEIREVEHYFPLSPKDALDLKPHPAHPHGIAGRSLRGAARRSRAEAGGSMEAQQRAGADHAPAKTSPRSKQPSKVSGTCSKLLPAETRFELKQEIRQELALKLLTRRVNATSNLKLYAQKLASRLLQNRDEAEAARGRVHDRNCAACMVPKNLAPNGFLAGIRRTAIAHEFSLRSPVRALSE